MDLPRNLYKSPGSIIFNATKSYDTIIVEDMEEYKAGIEAGYIDSFSGALNNEIEGEFEVIQDEIIIKEEIPVIKKTTAKKPVIKKEADEFDDF